MSSEAHVMEWLLVLANIFKFHHLPCLIPTSGRSKLCLSLRLCLADVHTFFVVSTWASSRRVCYSNKVIATSQFPERYRVRDLFPRTWFHSTLFCHVPLARLKGS